MWPSRLPALSFLVLLGLGCRPAPPGPATVEDIQHAAAAIDLDSAKLHEDRRDFDRPTGGSVAVLRFKAGRKLLKVSARYYSESGQSHHAYYLHNELPFLVVYRLYWFHNPNSQRVMNTLTESLYYARGTLLRATSVDSPDVGSEKRQISTPLDSAANLLHKLLAMKKTR